MNENKNENWLIRSKILYGQNNLNILSNASVAIFGLGGVGSYCAEAIARSGVGNIHICDGDIYQPSNINRQLGAVTSTIGHKKTDFTASRIKDINPKCNVYKYDFFLDESSISKIEFTNFDYVIDAIDTIKSKILIIKECKNQNIRIISAMGAGNRTNPELIKCTDLYKTINCPLSKIMRHELRKQKINSLDVAFSSELPHKVEITENNKHNIIGSSIFVPATMGLLMASKVINGLILEGK